MKNLIIGFLLSAMLVSTAFAGNIKGTVKAKGARNGGNAVIYIDKIEGKVFTPPKKHAKMDQKNLEFIPHVVPILVGSTVDFINSDDVLHNVFSPDKCADKFNLGTWAKGIVKSYTFKRPCASTLLCNVHPEMEAYVVVVETPYFTVSAKDGSYTIKNVPTGKYKLKIWHERLKGKSVEITVPATGEIVQDFVIHK